MNEEAAGFPAAFFSFWTHVPIESLLQTIDPNPKGWKRMLDMSRRASASLQITVCLLLASLSHAAEPAKNVQWPRIHSAVATDPVVEAKIASLVKQMTLEAKI